MLSHSFSFLFFLRVGLSFLHFSLSLDSLSLFVSCAHSRTGGSPLVPLVSSQTSLKLHIPSPHAPMLNPPHAEPSIGLFE